MHKKYSLTPFICIFYKYIHGVLKKKSLKCNIEELRPSFPPFYSLVAWLVGPNQCLYILNI